MVLRPARHKIRDFEDVPQANLLACMEKQNLTQQKHTFTNQKKCTTHNKHKTKPGLATSYDIRSGNGEGLFWFQHFIGRLLKTFTHLVTAPGPTRGTYTRKEPSEGTGFLQAGCPSCNQPTMPIHCRKPEALSPIHHWTPDGRGVGPFMPALKCHTTL